MTGIGSVWTSLGGKPIPQPRYNFKLPMTKPSVNYSKLNFIDQQPELHHHQFKAIIQEGQPRQCYSLLSMQQHSDQVCLHCDGYAMCIVATSVGLP